MERKEILAWLFAQEASGIKFGLENTRELLQRLGNPQDKFRAVHIAGTNGKGSVSAMTEAVLREAGYVTGLYTSPHLVDFSERIRVSGEQIPDAALLELAAEVQAQAAAMLTEGKKLTFFELTTAIAFAYFAQQEVEIAVIEVGMGGRLDATNVLPPEVCAITPISMEHAEFLGDTIAKIAAEKAGIIKPGIPVVSAPQLPEALAVIRKQTDMLTMVGEDFNYELLRADANGTEIFVEDLNMKLSVPLIGRYQGDNCAVAVAVLQKLMERGLYLPDEAIIAGLRHTKWPGRLETVALQPRMIVDCTHTPAGAEQVAAEVERLFGRVVLVFGVLKDKDVQKLAQEFAPRAQKVFLTTPQSPRALPAAVAKEAFQPYVDAEVVSSLAAAITAARQAAGRDGTILITGSLYMAGEAMEVLNVTENLL